MLQLRLLLPLLPLKLRMLGPKLKQKLRLMQMLMPMLMLMQTQTAKRKRRMMMTDVETMLISASSLKSTYQQHKLQQLLHLLLNLQLDLKSLLLRLRLLGPDKTGQNRLELPLMRQQLPMLWVETKRQPQLPPRQPPLQKKLQWELSKPLWELNKQNQRLAP